MYITQTMYDDVVLFVNDKTTINDLQQYVNDHHPELESLKNSSGNWQGRVIRRAAVWNNAELIKDFVDIAGKDLLNAKTIDENPFSRDKDEIPIVANCFLMGMKNPKELDTIRTLLDLGANVNSVSVFMGSPLHIAKEQQNQPVISLLESYGAIDISPTKKRSGYE